MSWKHVAEDSLRDQYMDEEIEEWFASEEESIVSIDESVDLEQKYRSTQLRIIRTNIDFTLHQLRQSLRDSSYINLSPVYQRRHRWDTSKKSQLIESFLLNIPIPSIFLFEHDYNQYEVMDGRQRLEAIRDYLNDTYALKGLEYWPELHGKKFSELPITIQRGLLRRTISATVLLAETSRPKDYEIDVRLALFKRLNTGGMRLNPQELRNTLHPSSFNEMLFRVSRWDLFRDVWNIPRFTEKELENPPRELLENTLYKTMADCELVLRLFAIKDTLEKNLGGTLRTLMDKTMASHSADTESAVQGLEHEYRNILEFLYQIFDSRPFVLPNTNRPSRPTYDALMVAASSVGISKITDEKSAISSRFVECAADSGNYEILVGRANTIEAIRERVSLARGILAGER